MPVKKMHEQIGLLCIAVLLVSACATAPNVKTYQEPEKNAPSSQLVLTASNTGPSGHDFNLFPDYVCSAGSGSGRLGFFGMNTATKTQTVRVAAGNRIFIRAYYVVDYPPGRVSSCTNLVSFIPENGATYELWQMPSHTQCKVSIKDMATGKEPAKVQEHTVVESCKRQ